MSRTSGEEFYLNKSSKRYHYNKETDSLIEVESIFFDEYHLYSSLLSGVVQLDDDFIPFTNKPEYYKNYILDDLYFLGFINHQNYNKIKENHTGHICLNSFFLEAFENYRKYFDSKTHKAKEPLTLTKSMEETLSYHVYKHYKNIRKFSENKNTKTCECENNDNTEQSTKSETPYIAWDDYFMAVCELVKLRSKDPSTKVGACIVKNNRILSTGYNGFPNHLSDEDYPWDKGNDDPTKNKYYYVVHAELNAILNARVAIEGSTLYVNKFPCNECAKAIIQSGIKKVIYSDEKDNNELFSNHLVSTVFKMLKDAGVEVENYSSKNISINITI